MSLPENFNPLYADKFMLVFDSIKHVQFFCASVNLPGVSLQDIPVFNPLNMIYVGGTKLNYEVLNLEFRVDEDLRNYREILNWMTGISAPQHTNQFKDFNERNNKVGIPSAYNIFTDATLISLTNASNTNIKVNFKDIFPISLQGLQFGLDNSQTIQAAASFRYNFYVID